MRNDAELDAMHDAVVRRFPTGLTGEQFAIVTLESADDEGRVYPHTAVDWFKRQSLLMGLFMDGLLLPGQRGYHEPMWWKITDKGREWLAERVKYGLLSGSPNPQNEFEPGTSPDNRPLRTARCSENVEKFHEPQRS